MTDNVTKLLTLSMDHICHSTSAMLAEGGRYEDGSELFLTIGSYGDYGWFLWVPGTEVIRNSDNIPADLTTIFTYARQIGCSYLLLDIDGEVNPNLPVYPEE